MLENLMLSPHPMCQISIYFMSTIVVNYIKGKWKIPKTCVNDASKGTQSLSQELNKKNLLIVRVHLSTHDKNQTNGCYYAF